MVEAESALQVAALLLAISFLMVALCARFGIPKLVGYLLSGILMGPSGFHLVSEGEALTLIGEIGVILLLFALGLEFSLTKLLSLKRLIFGLGVTQVLVTGSIVFMGLSFLTGLETVPAILIAGAVAMSSTAMCLKTLAASDALNTPHGRITIAVLLFQDLAAVGLLLLHDSFASHSAPMGLSHPLTLLASIAAFGVALWIAKSPMQRVAAWVEKNSDVELAQLLALAIALLAALAATQAGLSPALGAFAAGMMISEGDARRVVEREIRPFRDLFAGIFFVGIGAQIRSDALPEFWPVVLVWLCVFFVLKLIVVYLLSRTFGENSETSFRTGAILAHGGEFGLMILSVSAASGMIAPAVSDPLLVALGVSLLAGAIMVRRAA